MTKIHSQHHITIKILIGMLLGSIIGCGLNYISHIEFVEFYIIDGLLKTGGTIFITVMKMLVVPIVFVSLVCGTCSLKDPKYLGRFGLKTLALYIFTTAVAISIGLSVASLISLGSGHHIAPLTNYATPEAPSLTQTIINIFPSNPLHAMVTGNMLQVIVFSIMLGIAISIAGENGKVVNGFFISFNEVLMKLVTMLMRVAPYGVFCLLGNLFAKLGIDAFQKLLSYFIIVILCLLIHVILTNSIILRLFAGLNPLRFFKKMYSAMLFAFSTSSSNVSIPVTLDTVENKLGVDNSVASFVVPLGATINMDGTAIMQGVATVFIANSYDVKLTLANYLVIILTATLASIGTAGVPGIGLITLSMVLKQVGLPVEGIAMIIGVDRILDMIRTAVNITGDSAIACLIARSENRLSLETFQDPAAGED